jgi:hypothetical protein
MSMLFLLGIVLLIVTISTLKQLRAGNSGSFSKEIGQVKCIYIVFISVYILQLLYYGVTLLWGQSEQYYDASLADLSFFCLVEDYLPIAIVFYTHFKNIGHLRSLFLMVKMSGRRNNQVENSEGSTARLIKQTMNEGGTGGVSDDHRSRSGNATTERSSETNIIGGENFERVTDS